MNALLALLLAIPVWTGDVLLEAEDAESVGVVVDTMRAGFSGTGYVTGFDAPEDSLRFHFDAAAGVYEIRLGYYQSVRIRSHAIWIDGVEVRGSLLNSQGGFMERAFTEVRLAEGAHTLVFKGNLDLDYLRLVPIQYAPPAAPPAVLVDPDATASARALFAFLLDTYGKQVLSGQQELSEIGYIERTTGKVPAIGAFDLIEYSPSRREHGSNPGSAVEGWIHWADRDGIVTVMWHWNAPTDLIDEPPDRLWWSGFYTRATTFDFAAALADTTSERYHLMLRDIDAIAVQLKKLQAADVPVLWRPLHEAAGGWFWWGSKGPEPFRALWHLLYDRLVNHHQIHNLIWVYTHEPNAIDWYPGDAYVDIVSRDVYANDPTTLMRGDWAELMELYGDRKLITLSESGTLPDLDAATDFGVWWSWFALWTGPDFIRAVPAEHLRRVFTSERVLTRDELPDWRSYVLAAAPSEPLADAEMVLYPNPSRGTATLRLALPEAAEVQVDVFDVTGRQVRTYALGFQPAGALETAVEAGMAAGVYLVRVTAGGFTAHRTLVVAQ